ncbi:winged helix DNA-binding domain-containing protein [Ramicandelaber brevisporus]|nr:winged helix DNA-binding domain-containing protein [Ramicandelaber brevisporus]
MRKGVGVAGIKRQQAFHEQLRRAGDELARQQLDRLNSQLESFKRNLETFAHEHRKDIESNPVFRARFQRLCRRLGVDLLASNKSYWSSLFGVGEFYHELGIQIIEACLQSRKLDGGLTELSIVKRRVEKMRAAPRKGRVVQAISDEDIVRAVEALKPLGSGFCIVTFDSAGSGGSDEGDSSRQLKRLVQSVPRELTSDQSVVLGRAQRTGNVTLDDLCAHGRDTPGWTRERAQSTLDAMLRDGLCWLDIDPANNNMHSYWVPSYFVTM